MKFSGEILVRVPREVVWNLLVDPAAFPRYATDVAGIEDISAPPAVGARRYVMLMGRGRRVEWTRHIASGPPNTRASAGKSSTS